MRRLLFLALIATLAVGGCMKARPNTTPQVPPPLDVPPPPPRVIAPPAETDTSDDDKPAAPDTPTIKRPAKGAKGSSRPGPTAPQPEAAKPAETTPEPLPAPVETAKPAASQPPVALQPELKASTPEMRKQIEAQLQQSEKDLGRVYYQGLSNDARTQYDAAKQFIAQSRTALKEGNLVFAQKLAEKAVGLASNLVPR